MSDDTPAPSDKEILFELVKGNGMLPMFKMVARHFGKLNGALVVEDSTGNTLAGYGKCYPEGERIKPASGYHEKDLQRVSKGDFYRASAAHKRL